jgi:hypothetical protein
MHGVRDRGTGAVTCDRGWSADPRPTPDDPKIPRPRLEPIDGCGDVVSGRLGRPALAHALDLAAALQVLQPGERLVSHRTSQRGSARPGKAWGHVQRVEREAAY